MRSKRVLPILIGLAIVAGCSSSPVPSQTGGDLPLHKVGELALTGGTSRFDYTSLDAGAVCCFWRTWAPGR